MRVRVLALAALVLLASCGDDADDPATVSREAAQRLGEIRSGELDMQVTLFGSADRSEEVGFALQGVFALAEEGELPEVDVTYERTAGSETLTGRFVSDGETAFVERDGERVDLSQAQVESLVGSDTSGASVFEGLEVDRWMTDPTFSKGDGSDVRTVESPLDVAAAMNDLLEIARDAGAVTEFEPIEGEEADRLRAASEDSTILLSAGDDGLLRDLVVEIDLALDRETEIGRILEGVQGGMTLELHLDNVNEDVDVA